MKVTSTSPPSASMTPSGSAASIMPSFSVITAPAPVIHPFKAPSSPAASRTRATTPMRPRNRASASSFETCRADTASSIGGRSTQSMISGPMLGSSSASSMPASRSAPESSTDDVTKRSRAPASPRRSRGRWSSQMPSTTRGSRCRFRCSSSTGCSSARLSRADAGGDSI